MNTFLGVDGGGSKTAFLLIDDSGRVLASHAEGSAYHLEIGWDALRALIERGIRATWQKAAVLASTLKFAFLGLPAYGEDSRLTAALDGVATPTLAVTHYRCANDAVCAWAGALACQDGINLVAGTGSIAYGEFEGRVARAGGWGELFSDEGSAYWIAREGLRLFSRMSDGRAARGPLYELLRSHFGLQTDLDLCAAIYDKNPMQRSHLAALAPLIAQASLAGDEQVSELFDRAAQELAQLVEAVRDQLDISIECTLPVSFSGGMFKHRALLCARLTHLLEGAARSYHMLPPRLPPVGGAALYAAKLGHSPLSVQAVERLESQLQSSD